MPDDLKNQAASEGNNAGEGQDEGADQNKTPDATDTGAKDKEVAGKGEGEDKKDTSKQDDDQEPPVRSRLTTQDYIIGRQKAKLAKQEKEEEDERGDDNGIAPEDEDLITRIVAKKFAPIFDKTLLAADDKEVSEFVKANPDFAPFEAKARRYIQHPSRRHLPVETIFYEVAGKTLLKIGADRQKKADEDAKNTQTGGGSNRAGESAKSDWDLSKDEFEAKQERIRRS